MIRPRAIALSLLVVAGLLVGAATLWQSNDGGVPRYARVLLLDPRTGETLHQRTLDGGYAVATLLRGGRVAVGTLDGCPDHRGGRISVLDSTLARVIRSQAVDPCVVARLDSRLLRMRFEPDPGYAFHEDAGGVTVPLGRGRIVETYADPGQGVLTRIAAYDAGGRVLWQSDALGRIGVAEVRGGRILLPVFGRFTPGSD